MKNQRIVNLRALAIILVVLGHSIILYSSGWNLYNTTVVCKPLDYLKEFIGIIQMPLFFSLSGYLFYYSQKKKKTFATFLKDKVYRLLIPFLAFAFAWMLPIRLIIHYPDYSDVSLTSIIFNKILLGYDNGHLWFLQAIFLIFIIMFFICRIVYDKNNVFVYMLVLLVLLTISYFSNHAHNLPILYNTLNYLLWFYVGFIINRFENLIISSKMMIISLILSVSLVLGYFIVSKASILTYMASLVLIILFYNVVPNTQNKLLSVISANSFGVYLIHSPLIYITFTYLAEQSPVVVTFINFILFGGFALLLSILVRKTPLRILVGE